MASILVSTLSKLDIAYSGNDFEDALHHLELSLKDNSTHGEIGKAVLLILHSETFEPLRKMIDSAKYCGSPTSTRSLNLPLALLPNSDSTSTGA